MKIDLFLKIQIYIYINNKTVKNSKSKSIEHIDNYCIYMQKKNRIWEKNSFFSFTFFEK